MTCYHPRKAWRSRTTNANGKRSIVFNETDGYSDLTITIPCQQCIGCRLEKSRQWAIRCTHEAQLNELNAYITLTYNQEHLPVDQSINLRHFQLFMKRLRKKAEVPIRFFHCGEYGDENKRPHYHAIIFGFDFEDKTAWSKNQRGDIIYRSKLLEKTWGLGFSTTGDVTFESAAYVARYIMKKMTGPGAANHYKRPYQHIDPYTGEIHNVVFDMTPEYTTMSRRPGIGSGWLKAFPKDTYPSDEIIMRGKKMRPPVFYDREYGKEQDWAADPLEVGPFLTKERKLKRLRAKRRKKAEGHEIDQTPDRLNTREKVQQTRLNRLVRPLEGDESDT